MASPAQQHFVRANHLLGQGDRAGAIQAFRAAAAAEPDSLFGRLCEARALIEAEQPAEAWLRETLRLFPDQGTVQAMLATELADGGRFDEARRLFRQAVRRDPSQVALYYDLARSAADPDPGLLDEIRAALTRPGLQPRQQIALHLAAGRLHDLAGDPQAAVAAWRQAAAIGNAALPYDRAAAARHVDASIATFTPAFFATAEALADPTDLPLLIVGLPRSGTTLLEQSLTCHPQVAGAGERAALTRLCRAMPLPPAPNELAGLGAELRRQWLAVLQTYADPETRYVIDKLPQNYLWLGFVRALFPAVRTLHIGRDPRDTGLSILGTFFGRRPIFPATPADIVFHVGQYRRLMAHWRQVIPADRLHELDYEALVADPDPALRGVADFLGLADHSPCLRPERNDQPIRTASKYQARRPIGAGSVGRWQRYRDWLPEWDALG